MPPRLRRQLGQLRHDLVRTLEAGRANELHERHIPHDGVDVGAKALPIVVARPLHPHVVGVAIVELPARPLLGELAECDAEGAGHGRIGLRGPHERGDLAVESPPLMCDPLFDRLELIHDQPGLVVEKHLEVRR
jgi:hypothetical protein